MQMRAQAYILALDFHKSTAVAIRKIAHFYKISSRMTNIVLCLTNGSRPT